MNNFVFHNPTKIIFGKNTIGNIGAETKLYGSKVLLVYGKGSIKTNRIYEKVISSLSQADCVIHEFCGIPPNPTLSKVREGIQFFRERGCEVICAVGGGSVIDTGKAISCGVPVQHDVWKFFTTKKSIKTTVPLTCASTVIGSGSDNNGGMVISNDLSNHKFGYGNRLLHPKVSILDPETTYSLSPKQIAYGCVDIISHLTEFYCTNSLENSSLQNRIIEGVIMSVMENCEEALNEPTKYNCRAQLMWAASLALSGFTAAGLGRVGFPMHLVEHSLSALYNTTHGAGLAVILPAWMKHESSIRPHKIARLGRQVFNIKEQVDSVAAELTARYFKEWFKKIGCPVSLAELCVPEEDYLKICQNSQHLGKIWRLREYDEEKVLSILKFGN